MRRRMARVARVGWLVAGVLALSQAPLHAELSANDFNAQLLKARDEARKPLTDWQAAVTAKTKDKFDEVKGKLAEAWKEGRADAVKAVKAKLDARRQAITDQLAGDPERLDRVAKKLKEIFDARVAALEEAGKKFDTDATAFQLPTTGDVHDAAKKKLAALTEAALAPVSDAEWGTVFESVKAAFAEPTADDRVRAADATVKRFIDEIERDFSRIVKCDFTEAAGTLICNSNLAVSAAQISTIEVSGLPHDKRVTVSASAAKDAPTAVRTRDGMVDPESDVVTLAPGQADKVSIDVHLARGFKPTYEEGYKHPVGDLKGMGGPSDAGDTGKRTTGVGATDGGGESAATDNRTKAVNSLRWAQAPVPPPPAGTVSAADPNQGRERLILIVSGRAPQITVEVKIEGGKGPHQLVSSTLELGYARWGIDSGGFFAISALADEQLETEPTTNGMVRVRRRGGGSDWSQDTGIFLNLVPKNYPIFGIGVGFSANKDQPNTFYLGPSLRLLSFRDRGVASFSVGATVRSVKRFPGLNEGMEVSATDPRLDGTSQLKFAPYAVVQLGFSFGRIPGARDEE